MKSIFQKRKSWFAVAATLALFAYQIPVDPSNDPVYKNLDTTVSPRDNFFQYANGGWLKRNPIPAAYSGWGIGNVVGEEIRERLRKINEDAIAANAPKGSGTQKIGDFYFSGIDSVAIENEGINPIRPLFAMIDGMKDVPGIIHVAAYLTTSGNRNFISSGVGQDAKNSSKTVLQLREGGLGLPNRDYYFRPDARTTKTSHDYTTIHLTSM